MPRLARVVAPSVPHHATQRGNRRQPTFFVEKDYGTDLELMAGLEPVLRRRVQAQRPARKRKPQ